MGSAWATQPLQQVWLNGFIVCVGCLLMQPDQLAMLGTPRQSPAACRPVDCISRKPGPRYLPGVLSNKIFSDQAETGWGISTYPNSVADPGANQVYAVDQQLQTTRLDYRLETLNGTCFTFPSGEQYKVSFLHHRRFCPGILHLFWEQNSICVSSTEICSGWATRLQSCAASPNSIPHQQGALQI